MADILTEEGKRLVEKGKVFLGTLFSMSLNVAATWLFLQRLNNPRGNWESSYFALVLALIAVEIAAGYALKPVSKPFGRGIILGAFLTPLIPIAFLWVAPLLT